MYRSSSSKIRFAVLKEQEDSEISTSMLIYILCRLGFRRPLVKLCVSVVLRG